MQGLHYDMAISASQECIEFSVKATFLLLVGNYQEQHLPSEKEFQKMLSSAPPQMIYISFPRLWMLMKFWAAVYKNAKYGSKELKVSADRLFEKEDAELALKHAEYAYGAADSVRWWRRTAGR